MRWFLLSFSLTVLIFGGCSKAFAQAGLGKFGSWATERVGGKTITTFTPNNSSLPTTRFIDAMTVGGSVQTIEPNGVKWSRSSAIPWTSGYTGATQTIPATVARVATKQAVVKAVARTALAANPLGMTIMIGMAANEIFKWEDGQLKTKLVTEESEDETSYSAVEHHVLTRPNACGPTFSQSGPEKLPLCEALGAFIPAQGCSGFASVEIISGNCVLTYSGGAQVITVFGSQYTCPNGGTLQGNQCVKPAFTGCPEGYQVVPELSGDYRCAPITPLTAPDYPATEQMMEDTVGDLVGNDPSKLEDAVNWWQNQPNDVAEPIETGNIQPSGPSQLQPSMSTQPTQNGGTKETIAQPNVTYNIDNSTINITENVTNIFRNEAGEEIGREEIENPQEEVPNVTDGDLPEVPDFYEQKYPAGMAGVWTEKKAALMSSPFSGLITSFGGNFGDGGQCPSWTLPSPLLGLNFDGEVQMPCWIWDVLGVIFVVTSLFAARRIIFGG